MYATRFPQHVGRFVLDGVVDPTRVWYAANVDQDGGFNRNIDIFFGYLAAHPHAFRLGHRAGGVRRGLYRELRRLVRHPAAHGRLGPDELADALIDAAYYVYDWVELGHDYSALVRHHRGGALLRPVPRVQRGRRQRVRHVRRRAVLRRRVAGLGPHRRGRTSGQQA